MSLRQYKIKIICVSARKQIIFLHDLFNRYKYFDATNCGKVQRPFLVRMRNDTMQLRCIVVRPLQKNKYRTFISFWLNIAF